MQQINHSHSPILLQAILTTRTRLWELLCLVRKWHRHRITRTALSRLDTHLLSDIGISSKEALKEADKAFWED